MSSFAYQLGGHPEGLGRSMQLREKGKCQFCGDPIDQFPGAKEQFTCAATDCKAAYNRAYRRDRQQNMKASEWAISIREDVRKVAAHPCIYTATNGQANAQCGVCATCSARRHLEILETAK